MPGKRPTPAPRSAASSGGRTPRPSGRPSLLTVDLNLLVVLDALHTERSVTRAAERLGLTQPAMSQALNRLRKLFEDPLFVRTSRGMIATPRATELAASLHHALGEIAHALASTPTFDPRSARRVFTIATLDYCEIVILLPLRERLAADAPGIDLQVRMLRFDDIIEELEAGEVDLAIGVLRPGHEPALYRQKLFHERFVCIVRADHPTVGETVSLAEYLTLDHALVSPRGRRGGVVDGELAKRGLERRVALIVPHFAVAPMVVARSDLVLTVPERIAQVEWRRYSL